VEFVGHVGGLTLDVAVQGNYAYIGEGPRLTILDISNPTSPSVIGKTPLLPDFVGDVDISEGYAYITVGLYQGLRVVDISDPANPMEVGSCASEVRSVTVTDNYAYIAAGYSGLQVVDISDPTHPMRAGSYDTPGIAYGVAITESYAYIADSAGLRVLDISNPTNPTELGFCDIPGNAQRVVVVGSHAYVASGDAGLRVVDVSTPTNPVEVGFYDTPGHASDVTVTGGYAYVIDRWGGLRVVDIITPTDPMEVGFNQASRDPHGIAVAGNYAYVALGWDSGLQIVDISNSANPTEVGFYDTPGYVGEVAVAEGYAHVTDNERGLWVVDVSTPTHPTQTGFYDTPGGGGETLGVAIAGDYAYVADGYSGLRVVDVSDPAHPTEVGSYDTTGLAYDVAIAGNYAYVTDGQYGLRVVDISNPTHPTEMGFYDTPGYAFDVAIAGAYAYVADGQYGLRVIDISSPTNPTEVGFCSTLGSAIGLAIAGDYVYVADYDASLRVVDASTPASPTEIGCYEAPDHVWDVAVTGNYAYVAAMDAGLRVVNVSTKSKPTEVDFYDTPGNVMGVTIAGSYIYVADWHGGLLILHHEPEYHYLPLVLRNWEYLPQPITPNDTHYTTYQWNLPQVRASYAWAVSTGSSDVVVAVLDTGADLTHPDLQGKFVAGYDFIHNGADPSDDEGHGTHVAGIVAALTDNSRGVAGVSWGGKIMPVKVLDWQGLGVSSQIAQGIIWATDHGARIINMSLGGENGSATLQNAVNYAYSRGALVVAAAGNEYQAGNPVIYPAAYPHVLAVAATGNEDEHARYSETGYYVDVAAPGGNPTSSWDSNPNHWIMSTCWRGASYGEYAQIAGTSQAAPHVAGLAALVWSVNPTLSNDQVEQIIEETAVDVGTPGRDDVFGYGRIDAYRALARASRGALAAEPVQGQPALPSAHVSLSSISRVPIRGTEPTRAEFAAGVVLVKFRSGVRQETISSVLGRYSVQVTGRIPALGVLRLSVPVGAEIDVSERLSQDPAVEYAEPDYLVQAFRVQ